MKTCTKCGATKPLSKFHRNKNKKDGRNPWCSPCQSEYAAAHYERNKDRVKVIASKWRAENPEHVRRMARSNHLRRSFGLSVAEYEKMLFSQMGACAVCFLPPAPGKCLHVDHDHTTGAVRGLLCNGCNRAIGFASDSPSVLRNAAAYLESRV